MLIDSIILLSKEALWVSIIASLPAILASLVIGLLVAVFSATTQIQEQTLSFAPKMLVVYLVLFLLSAHLGQFIIAFTKRCFSEFYLYN